MGAFFISPVRKMKKGWLKKFFERFGLLADKEEQEQRAIEKLVNKAEKCGLKIYWPKRDTNQNDPCGIRICMDNAKAILKNKTTMVWWNKKSQGSLFDFGMAFMLAVLEYILETRQLTAKSLEELLKGRWILTANHEQIEKTSDKSFNNVLLELDVNHGILSDSDKIK